MVVDDNEVNTMILANMLELFGIHADQANYGMQAVIMSRRETYDIVFIDHFMPEMDGLQTTTAIRNISLKQQKTIIIALTSNITESIRLLYKEAGANAVYSKPLGLNELISILKQWCPDLPTDIIPDIKETPVIRRNSQLIQAIIDEIDDIEYSVGLRYAIGNPNHYINILEVSIRDMELSIYNIYKSHEKKSLKELQLGVHKLSSILTNIGAVELSERAKIIETNILQGHISNVQLQCIYFIRHVENLKEELHEALGKYYNLVQKEDEEQELVNIPMSKEEYEQSLLNTIYYIKRFEYDAIMKELELLILRGFMEFKQELELALADIKDFDYEKALERIIKLKMR
jgi:CheY-like chemotaxis protein/HPt (histidine-containing phosphotransfer) domain-containing protein